MNPAITFELTSEFFIENMKVQLAPTRTYLAQNIEIKYGNKGYSLDEMQDIFRGKKCTTKNY